MLYDEIKNKSIEWKKVNDSSKYFSTFYKDRTVLIRINNFPDEPICTFINGSEIIDIEDVPNSWQIDW